MTLDSVKASLGMLKPCTLDESDERAAALKSHTLMLSVSRCAVFFEVE